MKKHYEHIAHKIFFNPNCIIDEANNAVHFKSCNYSIVSKDIVVTEDGTFDFYECEAIRHGLNVSIKRRIYVTIDSDSNITVVFNVYKGCSHGLDNNIVDICYNHTADNSGHNR